MHFPSLTRALALALLFWNVSVATITFEDFPSDVIAGSTYTIEWTSDHDYQLNDFALFHWEDHYSWTRRLQTVDHYINTTAGTDFTQWTVPALKNDGLYLFWISAVQIDEKGDIFRNETIYASSRDFSIVGGPRLYPKEIAGIVVGSVAGLALLIVAVVFGARWLRKRRSVAVDLGPEGERYRDEAA